MSGVPLTLSQAKPDFESLVLQLQLFLNSKMTWSDLLTSSTGETLIEMMAAVGTFNQFAIELAAREGFLSTALRESSIYAITRMLGVRIARKAPAGTDVTLTRTGATTYPLLIPKFTQFTVNGVPFFNRVAILFNADQNVSEPGRLFEGTLRSQTIAADSTSFKEIYLNELNFSVSNSDVEVSIKNSVTGVSDSWTVIDEGIWTASATDMVFYDSTSGLGDCVLSFGDGYSGKLPSLGSDIIIRYAVNSGASGNNGGSGLTVAMLSNPAITGRTVSQITGGANEKPASYYAYMAPYLYKARRRAVTPGDYEAIASSYQGLASVAIQAQKDIAPKDLRWMNVIRICALPKDTDNLSVSEWNDFEQWFMTKQHAAIQIQRYNPEKVIRNVSVSLSLKATAIPEEVVPLVEANIRTLFERKFNTMGKRIPVSDITSACTVEGVDYFNLLSPTDDLVTEIVRGLPSKLQYFELGVLGITTKYSERS